MRLLSRLVSLALVLGVLVAFGLFLAPRIRERLRQIERYFPEILAAELTQYLGRQVTIGEIHVGGPWRARHQIEFDHLVLQKKAGEIGPALATVRRAVITYDPHYLTLHLFQPLSAIQNVLVQGADVYVLHDLLGQWNVLHIVKPGPPRRKSRVPLNTTILIQDSAVTYADLKPPHGRSFSARLVSIDGTVALQADSPVRFTVQGVGAPLNVPAPPGAVRLAGVLDVGDPGMDLHIGLQRAAIAPLLHSYFNFSFAEVTAGLAAGAIDLSRNSTGTRPPIRYAIRADFAGLGARVARLPGPVYGASGAFDLAGDSILFRIDRAIYGPATLTGSGALIGFSHPLITGAFTARGVTQGLLAPFVGPSIGSSFHLLAPARASLQIQGEASRPAVAGAVFLPDLETRGIRIQNATADIGYADNKLALSRLNFGLGGGLVSLAGNVEIVNHEPLYRLQGFARGVDIARLPLPASIRSRAPGGFLTADLNIAGAGPSFQVAARLDASRLSLLLGPSRTSLSRATRTVDVISRPGLGLIMGARLSARDAVLARDGRRYSARAVSAIINAQNRPGHPFILTSQGSLEGLVGGGVRIQVASWSMRPAGNQLAVGFHAEDTMGSFEAAGTAAPDLSGLDLQFVGRNVDLESLNVLAPNMGPLDGVGFLKGRVTGSLASPTVSAQVQVLSVAYGKYRFDRVHGNLTVTPGGINLTDMVVHLSPGEVHLDGEIELSHYHPTGLSLTATADRISLSRLARVLDMPLPATGLLNAQLAIGGSPARPVIAGAARIVNGTVRVANRRYPVSSARAVFRYAPEPARTPAANNLAERVAGLELTSLEVDSPMGQMVARGGPVGPGGQLALHIEISDVSLKTLRLPSTFSALAPLALHAELGGSVDRPTLIAQIPATPVAINGQRFTISATNVAARFELGTAPHPGIASLSIGELAMTSLDRPDELVTLSGQVMPAVHARARASEFDFTTLAGLTGRPLPQGIAGMMDTAQLRIDGVPNLEARTLDEMLQGLTGSLSVALRNLDIAPPTSKPTPSALPPPPVPTGPSTLTAANRPSTPSVPATSAAAVAPAPALLRFESGGLSARFNGPDILVDQLFLHQFARPTVQSPGIDIDLLAMPGGPPPHIDLGGGLDLALQAPLVPISTFAGWVPAASSATGALAFAVRATGDTSSPRLQITVDAVRPAPGQPPFSLGGIQLTVARMVATVQEGDINLVNFIVGAGKHIITASGHLPFTWKPTPTIPADQPMKLVASLPNDDLSILHDLAPDTGSVLSATGPLFASLTIGGMLSAPNIDGQLTAGTPTSPGTITLNHVDAPLRNLVLSVRFTGPEVVIDQFSGASDRGTFQVSGRLVLPSAANPGGIRLALVTRGLHLTDRGLLADTLLRSTVPNPARRRQYFEKVFGTLDSDITVDGRLMTPTISGSATLSRADLSGGVFPTNPTATPHTPVFDPQFRNLQLFVGPNVSATLAGVLHARPTATFSLDGQLSHPVLRGHIATTRGGGDLRYIGEYWRIAASDTTLFYEPPPDPAIQTGLTVGIRASLTTDIVESSGTSQTSTFFAPGGTTLHVTMDVNGNPFVEGGLHVTLSSDPPRSQQELEVLVTHQQVLQGIFAGEADRELPGFLSEVVRQTVLGSVLAPVESQLAQSLGLEEINFEYQYGQPVFLEFSKHWFDGVSMRMRRTLTGQLPENDFYLDYRLQSLRLRAPIPLGDLTLSFGLLDRLNREDYSVSIQSHYSF